MEINPGSFKNLRLPAKARGNTLNARINEYLEFKAVTTSAATHYAIRSQLRIFERFVEREKIKEVGPRAIYRFFIERSKTKTTMATTHAFLSGFFGWCVRMGYMATNPVEMVPARAFSKPEPEHKTFSVEDYEAMKRAAAGTEWYYAIVCAWHTGMRVGDVLQLRWKHVDMEKDIVSLVPMKTRRTSGKKITIPIHPELREILAARKCIWGPEEYISEPMARLYSNGHYDTQFKRLLEKAGIPKDRTFHCFRHTALERWMNSENADTITVMDMSGHTNTANLAIYCQPSIEKKRRILQIDDHGTQKQLDRGRDIHGDEAPGGGAET